MRKIALFAILLAFSAIFLTACSGKDLITSRAERFVRHTYRDVDRILLVDVDTVTYGDNLGYRMKIAEDGVKNAQSFLEYKERHAKEMKRYGVDDTTGVAEQRAALVRAQAWAANLDSLKDVSVGILDQTAAFNVCVAYNNPSNLVWVQLDPAGNLLNITKDRMQVLINPGDDVPGYYELWRQFNDR